MNTAKESFVWNQEFRQYLRSQIEGRRGRSPNAQRLYALLETDTAWSAVKGSDAKEDIDARIGIILTPKLEVASSEFKLFLISVITDRMEQDEVRQQAVFRLGFTTPDDYFDELRQLLLHDPAPSIQNAVAYSFRYIESRIIRRKAVSLLIKVLRSNNMDENVRGRAAETLGYIGNKAAVRPLIEMLKSPFSAVRFFCCWALGEIGDVRSLEQLSVIAASDDGYVENLGIDGYWIRDQASQAVQAIACKACMHASTDVVKSIIPRVADADGPSFWGATPLTAASQAGRVDVVRYLISVGAQIDLKDRNKGHTPLSAAAACGDVKTLQLLIDQGAILADGECREQPPITTAIVHRNRNAAMFLIGNGADVNEKDVNCLATALPYAVMHEYGDVVRSILQRGANPDSVLPDGKTALMLAAELGKVAMIKDLLAHGANRSLLDDSGLSAYALAKSNGHVRAARLIGENR